MERPQSPRKSDDDAPLPKPVNNDKNGASSGPDEASTVLAEEIKKIEMKPPTTPVSTLAKNTALLPTGIARVKQSSNMEPGATASGSATECTVLGISCYKCNEPSQHVRTCNNASLIEKVECKTKQYCMRKIERTTKGKTINVTIIRDCDDRVSCNSVNILGEVPIRTYFPTCEYCNTSYCNKIDIIGALNAVTGVRSSGALSLLLSALLFALSSYLH